MGGLEVNRWNKSELKRTTGIFFNDARSLSDASRFHSGSKLQEIIRPTSQGGTHEGAVRSAVGIATRFTGLSNSLLPRLPAKLDTIVTASEDDLKSPRSQDIFPLSTSEWSKVFLTKVIAQAILTNENHTSNPNAVPKSLVGSVLLLDDITNHLNEIEEVKLLKSLKSSGAASLITSKRWAIGRFADKIVVLKDGAVIESGTHSELMAKGSDNSVYASRWAQMLTS